MEGRAAAVLGLVLHLSIGKAGDLFPLGEGYVWTYRVEWVQEGRRDTLEARTRVAGRRKIGAVECFVVENRVGDIGSREFLSAGESGVMVHGGIRDGGEFFYEPPLPRLRYPLAAGASWEVRARCGGEDVTVRSEVRGEEEVGVPAGRYRAVKVVAVADTPAGRTETFTWYAAGVGVVRQRVLQSRARGGLEMDIELRSFEKGEP